METTGIIGVIWGFYWGYIGVIYIVVYRQDCILAVAVAVAGVAVIMLAIAALLKQELLRLFLSFVVLHG